LLIFIKMKKDILETVKIPEGIEVSIEETKITIKNSEGKQNQKEFKTNVKIEKKDNEVILSAKKGTKKEKRMINTTKAHINNMIKGVQERFIYKLKICFAHFPITAKIQDKELIITNFLGETKERKAKILDDVDVKIDKDIITVESHNKESAGQTSANFESTTKIRARDRRVFQDGIFITEKAGRKI